MKFLFPVSQYGGAPGGPAFPGQTQDPLYGYFAAVAGQVSFHLYCGNLLDYTLEDTGELGFTLEKNPIASRRGKRDKRQFISMDGCFYLNVKHVTLCPFIVEQIRAKCYLCCFKSIQNKTCD